MSSDMHSASAFGGRENPKFTLVTAVLNRVDDIRNMYQSVVDQLSDDYELLIVDNGSTDGTYEYCQSIKNDRIKVLRCRDKGLAFARNCGIREAHGEWIVLLDSDNVLNGESVLTDLSRLIVDESVDCYFTLNVSDKGENISLVPDRFVNRNLSISEYLQSNGEFTAVVRTEWFKNNLYPEIHGARTEFPYMVFLKAAEGRRLKIIPYVAQIYGTVASDRICSSKVTLQRASDLYLYYKMLMGEYGKYLKKSVLKTYMIWSVKLAVYGKLSKKQSLLDYLRTPASKFALLVYIMPYSALSWFVEEAKRRND